jgi:hypothetical protein
MLNRLAQASNNITIAPRGQFNNIGGNSLTLSSIISGLITLVLVIAAIVFFFMLIIGGLKWILSGGDKAQTESARNQITAALIGLVIVFGAFAIAQVVTALFGINIFDLSLPSFLNAAS